MKVDRVSILLASLWLGLTLSATCSTVATAQQAPDLIKQSRTSAMSERQIRDILDAMAKATQQQDVDGIVKYMAPKIAIKMTLRLGKASQQLSLTREQYRQYLEQGFALLQRYDSQYKNLKIQIASSGQTGTATYTLLEEATLKGQPGTLVSTSQETVKFERLKGQILATAVTSKSTIEMKRI
ncbi:nuclear transport factor 2 family protein [Phormidium sp. FACHB-592]|uniref:Nuclear transport factor 2 family protein n=1 Tax=Stenomitos frigidus AS-A4 TaxID=2933935 RepID=A0ABV0KQ53_9CYAN|nr:nuclear transport factor 2 family protein [Phormidium sp. FACHB-592]MBD2074143.1 nuclear transport factor 2 family protein [Phormidium sp. FACHB-592]